MLFRSIRGYENASSGYNSTMEGEPFNISWLSGTRMMVGNAELRLPLTGPERLAMIKSRWLLSDLNLFFDSGLAWNRGNKIIFDRNSSHDIDENGRFPIYSTGASLRINLFGYLVIEPYYAFPLQNGGLKNGVFGLNLTPGW